MYFLKPFNNSLKTNKSFYDMVDNFFNDSFFTNSSDTFRIDVKENDNEYYIEAELPGVNKAEIKLEYKNECLTIGVNREIKVDEEKENYIHKERKISSMKRSLQLKNINDEEITAKLVDGILTIVAPKKEVTENRIIEVK